MEKIVLLVFLFSILSCGKKLSDTTHCWQLVDYNGNYLQEVCGKTESELVHCTTCGSFGGTTDWNLDSCNYFCIDCNDEACYFSNGHHFKATKQYAKCWLSGATQVDCNYKCANWYTRYKYIYKPNSSFRYSGVFTKEYCDSAYNILDSPDSIIIENTVDSLVLLQRSKDGLSFH